LLGNGSIKAVSPAVDTYATVKELLEVVFSVQSVPGLCSEGHWDKLISHFSELPI
jgi:hypothetical protein